ncbi:hypothetical protein M2T59_07795 [Klebsiella pneumoniae]|uniref:hypothetical protein n=1 Tax=Klebsiella pneumoniae TaxID=573 RepID=UPI000DF3E42D|nr:hypothetical protein [Klebsiella pneumoniae]KAA1697904.1 hypothetical protein F1D75_17095 [Klebsiella pneumoniae]MBV0681143.1 hypothetical protein [Klebsiella pneumoniae]MCB2968719.1 hypothetical protein [Klebsiella pneumoniae]MCL0180172.1 hypothetical protein [Klebsiella pneumoniae]MCL0186384.1 hypothetical protein [Klebsiella pneumoniae]
MQGRQYSVTCYQPILEKQLLNKWQGQPTTKKPAPAVFNIPNGEKEMPNSSIMALALALCNAGTNSRVTIPSLTGRELLEWLSVLRVTV